MAPYLKTMRDRTAPDKERLSARRWLQLNGYESLAGVRAECDRVFDEIQLARLARADGLPVGKAPQCGHRALTAGCSVCDILRERMARVGVERAARILMAEMGSLGPADADDLRRQFGLSTPVAFREPSLGYSVPIPAAPPPRPDGFSQAQVDAAKAVLLAPAVKRGGR